ncbi:MAG: hypothetical protein NTV93_19205 [Verrucomicrobia bacterium]|nr:hypothetical protein [Verrucomicrobiota bacterium]
MIEKSRPEVVVSAGFSGALQPGLALGDIVIGENVSDPTLLRSLRGRTDYRIGQIITVPDILETAAAKRNIGVRSGALAADLESAHIFRICSEAGIPMLSVRTISDVLAQDMPVPGFVLINPDTGKSDPSAIFRYLFRHPAKVTQFAQLVSGARLAQQSLAKALGCIIPPILMRGHPVD